MKDIAAALGAIDAAEETRPQAFDGRLDVRSDLSSASCGRAIIIDS